MSHHGKSARVDIADDRPVLLPSAPKGRPDLSSLQDNTADEVMALAAATGGKLGTHRVADEDDLAWAIDASASAAQRARTAGADAVEIHAAHGHPLPPLLASADHRRDDPRGRTLVNPPRPDRPRVVSGKRGS